MLKTNNRTPMGVKITSDELRAIVREIPIYEAAAEYMFQSGRWTLAEA